jgi:hypothetical protein
MFHIHKWKIIKQNDKWRLERCVKCGLERWNENFLGGYQPKP